MTPLAGLAVVAAVVALAGLVSARLRSAAALVELGLGVGVSALLPVDTNAPWLVVLASVGGVALTYVAGSEIDLDAVRRTPGGALALGAAAFMAPFVIVVLVTSLGFGWSHRAALVAGGVLGETSLAVTYSVLLELRLVSSELGRLLMAAVFLTDVAAAAVMTALVSRPSWQLLAFGVGSAMMCALVPVALRFSRLVGGDRPSEPGARVVVAALAALLLLAHLGGGVAVLPAFVLGVVASRYYRTQTSELARLRTVVMGFLAPFVFVRAGMSVSLPAVIAGAPVIAALLAAKVLPKAIAAGGVLRRVPCVGDGRTLWAASALMSTGLTFGTIINLAALQANLIDRAQFSTLAATVLASAILPGTVAQRLLSRPPIPVALPAQPPAGRGRHEGVGTASR